MNSIKLGYTYEDVITKYTGIAIGFVQYISGCNQVLLQPRCTDDGTYRDSAWFDQQRLELRDKIPPIVLDNSETPGFDKMAPKR